MKVSRLEIQNVLGMKCKLEDLGGVVKLLGKTGAGKSRTIICLLAALKYDSLPIEKRKALLKSDGTITVDLDGGVTKGNWIIRRKVSNGKTSLSVKQKEQNLKGSQSTLDQFIGKNFVDLSKIWNMSKDKFEKVVLDILGLTEQLEKIKEKERQVYEERHMIGQDKKRIGFDSEEDEPEQVDKVSVSGLMVEYQRALDDNREIEDKENLLSDAQEKVASLEREILERQETLKATEKWITESSAMLAKMEKINTDTIKSQIDDADRVNALFQERQEWLEKRKNCNDLTIQYDQKTEELSQIKSKMDKIISSTKFPISQLSYDGDQLTYKGHTLISDGEYRSISFQIAKTLKGDLSIATFENFSLLDDDEKKKVLSDAQKAGFQLFVEIVSTRGSKEKDEFFIEEGELKKQ